MINKNIIFSNDYDSLKQDIQGLLYQTHIISLNIDFNGYDNLLEQNELLVQLYFNILKILFNKNYNLKNIISNSSVFERLISDAIEISEFFKNIF